MAKAKKDTSPAQQENASEVIDAPPAQSPLEAQCAELEEALKAEKDKYLRLAAEYDNFRKRTQKEREALFIDIRSETLAKLLPVYDNLARALSQTCTDEAFYKGVEMIMTQLKEIFEKLGVVEIPAVGQPFDPSRHNAVMHVEDPNYGENTVVDEFEKGFMLGDKIIRHSVVRVAN